MFSIRLTGEIKDWAKGLDKKVSSTNLQRINRDIFGRLIHAGVTWNFAVEARNRPRKWPELSPIYSKMKAKAKIIKYPMRQPEKLGVYPTPWNSINTRSGQLYNTLGTIFRVTPTSLTYGTTAPHASRVAEGQTVKRIHVEYITKTGKSVSYYKDLKVDIRVPARPFDFVSKQELQAGGQAAMMALMAKKSRKTIMIPQTSVWNGRLNAPGGHRIYVYGER
jgi:hypothetical protein